MKVKVSNMWFIALLAVSVALGQHDETRQQQVQPAQSPRVEVPVPAGVKVSLEKNGFAVVPNSWPEQLATLYRHWKHDHLPVVVTTDAALHTSHLYFDWYLRFLETAHLRGDLLNLTDALLAKVMEIHDGASGKLTREDALFAASYLTVAKRLLVSGDTRGAPAPWKSKIDAEIKAVEAAAGIAPSPLFGYPEDYSQYRPRGHYSRSRELETYFRTMMWFGRMAFRFKAETEEASRAQTRRALLICRALQSAQVKGETALAVWRRIYEITAFFAGRSDDLLPEDYIALTKQQGDGDLDAFIAAARKLRKPRILGTWAQAAMTGGPDWSESTAGMRLFGQRFAFDAEVMQQLVFDKVGVYVPPQERGIPEPFTLVNARGIKIRGFPRGLDVMAALGFADAERILADGRDNAFLGYGARLADLKKAIVADLLAPSHAPRDLYEWRLRSASELAHHPEGNMPAAMRSGTWPLKQLAAALGSWVELRHDTILYTKESYTASQMALAGMTKGGPIPPPPPPPKGYVEPMPRVYASIRGSVMGLRERFASLGFPEDKALCGGLERFGAVMRQLESIANKELQGAALTDEEYSFIENIGDALRVPQFGFPHHRDVTEPFRDEEDDLMPIVADVHTDVNSEAVLEEAVGRPFVLFMLCPVDGKPTVCLGAVYSYYEFKRPLAERLTDEKWRELLGQGMAPDLPSWMNAYVTKR